MGDHSKAGQRELVIVLIVFVTIAMLLLGTYYFVAGQPPFLGNKLSFLPAGLTAAFGFFMNLTWGLSRHLEALIRNMYDTAVGETAFFLILFLMGCAVWSVAAIFEKPVAAAMAEKVFYGSIGAMMGTNIGRNRQKNRHKRQLRDKSQ